MIASGIEMRLSIFKHMQSFLDKWKDLDAQLYALRTFGPHMSKPYVWLNGFVRGHADKRDYRAVREVHARGCRSMDIASFVQYMWL
jgi:hypothetical protein